MQDGETTEKYLRAYNPGDAFGELALLYNAPRAATIRAVTDCHLWALDRGTFSQIVQGASTKKRERYEEFLSNVPLLEKMDSLERSKIAETLKEMKFIQGDYVIREGEQGDSFYIILEGSAIATKSLQQFLPPQTVKSYGPGDYFGERALLKNEPRAASVIAASSTLKVVTLDRNSFYRLLGPLDHLLKIRISTYDVTDCSS